LQAVPCVSPSNHEWLKILASSVVGLFAGLVAEPFKSTLQRNIEIGRLKRAIVMDFMRVETIIQVAEKMGAMNKDAEEIRSYAWPKVELPAYQHYWAGKRELFYDNLELHLMHLHCASVMTMKQQVLDRVATSASGITVVKSTANTVLRREAGNNRLKRWVRKFFSRFIH
jgi:hypothetical protein